MKSIKARFYTFKSKIKRNRNSQFPIFLATAIIGYFLLFTSKVWMPDYNLSEVFTAMESVSTLDNRNFTLKNWIYSPEQNMMEVEVDVINNNFDNIDKYLFSCRDQNYKLLQTSAVIEEKNLLVVHILNIPVDFKELSFRIKVDYGEDNQDVGKMVRFYTNRDTIMNVDKIDNKTPTEYFAARLERNIKTYNQTIQSLQKEIDDISLKIALAENEIQTLKNNIPLQSVDEARKSNNRISQLNETILDFELQINTKQDSILETEEKIKEADTKFKKWNRSQQ